MGVNTPWAPSPQGLCEIAIPSIEGRSALWEAAPTATATSLLWPLQSEIGNDFLCSPVLGASLLFLASLTQTIPL